VKTAWLQRDGRRQALVFFAGWGMDERPFRRLTSSQYDVCVCFDYRDLDADFHSIMLPQSDQVQKSVPQTSEASVPYEAVTVVAWSFGCAVAAQVLAREMWPVRHMLAINGTVTPEDDQVGIPRRWLDATAESLLQGEGWPKFVRRMCLDKAARQDFRVHAPQRDLAGAIDELKVLRSLETPAACGFNRALVGTKDRIILPENQERGWSRFDVPVQSIAAPHYPFHLWSTWEELLSA
jgi:biotin synthesis protein BioG